MLQYDFEESIGYWLTLTTQAYQRSLAEKLAPHGITHRQSHVLGWLALDGDITQTALAKRMLIEPPTLVGILNRMERAGWIRRIDCPGDRRKKLVRLSPDAEPVWGQVVECAQQLRREATQGLTPEQVATLKELLSAVHKNLGERTDVSETDVSETAEPGVFAKEFV